MTDTVQLPLFHNRCRIGQIRHLIINAGPLMSGAVAELSNDTSKELAEIWFMPESANSFLRPMLDNAGVKEEELVDYCMDKGVQQRVVQRFFTSLSPSDAEWHITVRPIGRGVVISAIVGHSRSMQIARDHGLLTDEATDQRNIRKFAFE